MVVVVAVVVVVGAAVVVGRRSSCGAAVVGRRRAVVVGADVVVGGGGAQNDFGRPCGTYRRLTVDPLSVRPSRHTVGTVHPPTLTPVGVMTRWMVVPVRVYSSQQSVAAACTWLSAELATMNDVAPRATTRPATSSLDEPRRQARGPREPLALEREGLALSSRWLVGQAQTRCGERVHGENILWGGAGARLLRLLRTTRQLSGSRQITLNEGKFLPLVVLLRPRRVRNALADFLPLS